MRFYFGVLAGVLSLALVAPLAVANAVLEKELVGLASQTDATAFLSNPATVFTRVPEHDYVYNAGGGSYFNDRDNLIEDFDDAEAEGERLRRLSEERPLLPSDFDRQIALFKEMDGKLITLAGGTTLAVSLPIERVETTLIASIVGRIATSFDYAPSDEMTLRTAPLLGVAFPPDLKSRVIIQGVAISDVGLNFSGEVEALAGARVGVTVKYQGVRLLDSSLEIDEYDDVGLDEFRRGLDINHHLNFDIGIYKQLGKWHGSLAVKELNEAEFRGSSGNVYRQRPGVQGGLAYDASFAVLSMDVDLVPSQRRFGLLDDEKRFRLSGQFRINRRWRLGAGVELVMEGRDSDAVTLGAGYQMENGAKFNAALVYADDREFGTAAQLRIPFWSKN